METESEELSSQYVTPIWKNKNFMLLWSGSTISTFTFHILTLGLPLILYDLTKSSFAMSTMRAVEFLPNLLLAIVIGAIVDRYDRKRVLCSSIILKVLIVFILLILVSSGGINPFALYFLGFLLYTALYTNSNTYHSILPTLVTKEQLTEANSSISLVMSLLNIGGPAIAGLILFSTNYTVGLTITLTGLIILLICSLFINVPKIDKNNKNKETNGFLDEMKEGMFNLYNNKLLWDLTIIVLFGNIVASLSLAVIVFYALDYLHLAENIIGILFASIALGGACAAIVAKKTKKFGRGKIIFTAICLELGCYIILFLTSGWILVAIALFIKGFCSGLINVHYFTLRQETTPRELLGRVAGTSSTIMKLALPFSYLSAGYLAEIMNVSYLFLISGILSFFLVIFTKSRGIILAK